MAIDHDAIAACPAEQLIERLVMEFAEDVPESDLNSADRLDDQSSGSPLRPQPGQGFVQLVPDKLHLQWVFAHQQWLHSLFNRRLALIHRP